MSERIIHYYRKTEPSHSLLPSCKEQLESLGLVEDGVKILGITTESCFNVQLTAELTDVQTSRLEWLLAETFEKENLHLEKSSFDMEAASTPAIWQVEFGPRMTFTSAFSSNAASICKGCDLPIPRLELSRRYRFELSSEFSVGAITALTAMLHDRMTEEEYKTTLTTFDNGASPVPVRTIPIMAEGRAALEKINNEMGLGFDDFDLDYYTELFRVRLTVLTERMVMQVCDAFCLCFLTILSLSLGKTWKRPHRCRMLRYGAVELGAFAPLVFWWKDDY